MENSITDFFFSKAKVTQYNFKLQSQKKGGLSMRNYLIKMETYLYILSSSEHNIYEDQILAILAGFGPEYDSVVAMITSVKIHIL